MHYFLDSTFDPGVGSLNPFESRHAAKVLRCSVGDEIEIGDGRGNRFLARINSVSNESVKVEVMQSKLVEIGLPILTIALAPTKNATRFEWFVEKATELGVHGFIPLQSKRTERPRFNQSRTEKIILAAAKQSGRSHLPLLHGLTPFEQVLEVESDSKYIAHCEEEEARRMFVNEVGMRTAKRILILIGPEGDFTPEEISAATRSGFTPVSLGKNRLRTETAGIYAAAVVHSLK